MRGRRLVFCTLLLAAAAAVAVAGAGAKHKPKKPVFTPAVLAGTWRGTWNDSTFGTAGPLTLVVQATATTLSLNATLGGNMFGCAAPSPQPFTLTKGAGDNHWNAAGWRLSGSGQAFGAYTATYAYPSGAFTATGKDPACAPGLSFVANGRFAKTAFSATVKITLPPAFGGGTADATVSLTRS